ncbi:AbiTii domain-containing protein [Oceanisphaera sp. W20_SRM_FM3]|uniref:AbiTii domain-containing protein n=1 Tax=Oceanisphaera sp. W20_SRM_FM3 TaxID=3240267 RepID=UPI003F96AF56
MSLLRDIQSSAVDANEPLGTLLRKCKILAARLGNAEFKHWVESELNGYDNVDCLPEYRIISVACKGHFSGAFGSGLRYADIPSHCIPKEIRGQLFTSNLTIPVSSIESLIRECSDGVIAQPWNSNLTVILGKKIYEGMHCLEAWRSIPENTLVGLLDKVRNKILDFVLEIEGENPAAGEAPVNSKPVPEEKVSQIFNTYITGDVQNLATASNHVTQHAVKNDNNQLFNELLQAISKVNDVHGSQEQIVSVVEEMRHAQGSKSFLDKYNSFVSLLADHMQVYGTAVMPFLPKLTALIS